MIDNWLDNLWCSLVRTREQGKLPHALLFQGVSGIGKLKLARQLAQAMLCPQTTASGSACGECHGCRLFNSGTHPDFLQIQPEEPGKAIKVDQIRQMTQELSMTSHAGGYKVVVIVPAENMNINAANSLLKTLEEPTDNTLILLVSEKPAGLPVTVRSRCQAFICPRPALKTAENWLRENLNGEQDTGALLEMANGAPYLALSLHESDAVKVWVNCLDQLVQLAAGRLEPLTVAADWNKHEGKQKLEWFLLALQKMMLFIQAGEQGKPDRLTAKIQVDLQTLDSRRLFVLMDNIKYAINHWSSGLNTQLLLEDILISWAAIFKRSAMASGQN